jgi:hypothetical protein
MEQGGISFHSTRADRHSAAALNQIRMVAGELFEWISQRLEEHLVYKC